MDETWQKGALVTHLNIDPDQPYFHARTQCKLLTGEITVYPARRYVFDSGPSHVLTTFSCPGDNLS